MAANLISQAFARRQALLQRDAEERARAMEEFQKQQEQKQRHLDDQAVQFAQSGMDSKLILQAIPVSQQGRALVELNAKFKKEQEKKAKAEAEAAASKTTLADFYNRSAATGMPIPPGLDDDLRFRAHVASLESGGPGVTGDADFLMRIAAQNAAFSGLQKDQEFRRKLTELPQIEAAKARATAPVEIDTARTKARDAASISEEFESRKLATEGVIFGAARGDAEMQNHPVLRAVPYAQDRVAAERARLRIQDTPLVDAEQELRDLGVPVELIPKSKIRGYVARDNNGQYVPPSTFVSSQTKLLMNGKPGSTAQLNFQVAEATHTQLNTMEALIEVVRAAKRDPGRIGRIQAWLGTKIRDGSEAGDLSMIDALRSIGATPIARNVGQEKGASTEQDVSRVLESLPNIMEALAKNPNVYKGRLEAARRGLSAQLSAKYNSEYPREVWVPRFRQSRIVETARAKSELSQLFGTPFALTTEEVAALQAAGD